METHYTFAILKCRNRIIYWIILVLLILGQYSKADPNSFNSDEYANSSIRYRLVEGSTLTVNSAIEDRPSIQVPIKGYFWLKHLPDDQLFSNYAINNLKFKSSGPSLQTYSGSLNGTFRVGGEVAQLQQMVLVGSINNSNDLLLDSGMQKIDIDFPLVELDLYQIFPDTSRVYDLHLVAVPWPKIGFSTSTGFTSWTGVKGSDGDILSISGKIIRRNNQLTGQLGIMPIVPDLGLDAIMLNKFSNTDSTSNRSEIYFSLPQDIFSEKLGYLYNGDLLSDKGSIIKSYKDFIKPFGPKPPVEDYGLDAITYSNQGQFLFSFEKDFFSEVLRKHISNGDLLSEKGYVYKTNGELLSKFKLNPTFAAIDIGLDAVYLWPWGEIWFSTKSSFPVEQYGIIGHGDLLSSYGKVVFRNSELLSTFEPMEDLDDFGLDALEILWPYKEADLNEDDIVDVIDYTIFTQALNQESSINHNDSDGTIIEGNPVDLQDLEAFFEDWQE